MASVFISHSSRDGAVVDAIAAFVRGQGHHDVFLDHHPEDGIGVGERWEEVLYDRLHAADVVVAVVTADHVSSRWCFAEVALAKALGRHVFPVGAEAGVRHPLLTAVQAVDYVRDPDAALAALGDRLRVIEAGGGAGWDPSRPAFPGLAAFDAADAPMFFGREAETEQLASMVRAQVTQRTAKAVVVVGASGSGKSSLVRAGLVPRLLSEGWWALPAVLPGLDPFGALTLAIGQAFKTLEPERRIDRRELAAQVRDDFAAVVADLLFAAPASSSEGLLLVVDQLEEVFTRAARDDAAAFLALLDRAAEAGRTTTVVATIRSVYVSELLGSEPAGRLRESQFPLPPLGRASLSRVVTGPAGKARLELSEELVAQLVEDTGSGDALPLLAYVLRLLTEHAQPGDRFGIEDYTRIGGVQGALRQQADAALERAVTATGRTPAEILDAFVELVTVDGSGRPSRRRVARADVAEDLLPAYDVFVDARLLRSDEADGVETVGVAHEALFTAWPSLREALDAQTARLQLRRRLEVAAADWEREGREPSMLWRGEQLRAVLQAAKGGHGVERRFVEAAVAADVEERESRANVVADRATELIKEESELALLLLLAAGDKYAFTDAIVGGLRNTLARHLLVARIIPPVAQLTALAISEDGATIAAADRGTNPHVRPSIRPRPLAAPGRCRVSVWNVDTRALVQTLWFDGRQVTALRLDVAPAGMRITARIDGAVVAADVTTGEPVDAPTDALPDDGRAPETSDATGWSEPPFSVDSARSMTAGRFVVGDFHGIAVHGVAPVEAPTVVGRIDGHAVALRWPVDGTQLAVTADGRVIDIGAGARSGPAGPVLAVSRDAAFLLVDDPPRLHDTESGAMRALESPRVRAAGFSEDGRFVAIAGWGSLSVFAVDTGQLLTRFGEHGDEEGDLYTGVGLSRDGARLVTASLGGGRAHVWDVGTGEALRPFPNVLELSPDGGDAVTPGFRAIATEVSAGVECLLQAWPQHVLVHVAPDRSALLQVHAQSGSGIARELTLPDGHQLFVDTVSCVTATFSPDCRHVLFARADGTIELSPSRAKEDVIARARRHAIRPLSPKDRASFAL